MLVSGHPDLATAGDSIRFARNGVYAGRDERLMDGDELALIPPVAGGAGPQVRRIELRDAPFPDGLEAQLRRAVATTGDGAVVTFVGRTRETPGTPAPGETLPEGVMGQVVEGLTYEAFEPMALGVLDAIADEIAARFGVERIADRAPDRGRAPGRDQRAHRGRGGASGSGVRRMPLRDRGAQGAGPHLEAGTLPGWLGLDRGARAPRRAGRDAQRRGGRMRVYLSVDMEGLAGISHTAPTGRGDAGYPDACRLMEGEANAAIAGAFDGGATEVMVNDSHGPMFNLSPTALDPRARLVQGRKALSMVEAAADAAFDVALFVGYHARAGHPAGHHRAHLHRAADPHHARRATHRGIRHQRPVPRRPGRARRAGHGR